LGLERTVRVIEAIEDRLRQRVDGVCRIVDEAQA
jgi:hypothetical protein